MNEEIKLREEFERAHSAMLAAAEFRRLVTQRFNEAEIKMAAACRKRYEASCKLDDFLLNNQNQLDFSI